MASRSRGAVAALLLVGLAWATGSACGLLIGIDDLSGEGLGGANTGGNGGAGASGASGGAGGADDCTPGVECYTGPRDTEGIGVCQPGTCDDGQECGDTTPSTEVCRSPEDENCDDHGPCNGDELWSLAANGPGEQSEAHIAFDENDEILLAGTFAGSFAFPGGDVLTNTTDQAEPFDIFLVKLDHGGKHVWSKRFGDDQLQTVSGLATEGEDAILVGSFQGKLAFDDAECQLDAAARSAYVARFDGEGTCLWARQFEAEVVGVAMAGDYGGTFVAGHHDAEVTFGDGISLQAPSDRDGFVVRLDAEGTFTNVLRINGANRQEPTCIAGDGHHVFVAGIYDAQFMMAATTLEHPSGNQHEFFVAHIDASQDTLDWAYGFGGPSNDTPKDIAVQDDGSAVVAIDFEGAIPFPVSDVMGDGSPDSVLLKFLPPDPGAIWVLPMTAPGDQSQTAVAVDNEGQVVVTGKFQGTVDMCGDVTAGTMPLEDDAFLLKVLPETERLGPDCGWSPALTFTSPQFETGLDVATDQLGNIVVVGFYNGASLDMKPTVLPSADMSGNSPHDLFVSMRRP